MMVLGTIIAAIVVSVILLSRRRDWICVVLATIGLVVLAVSGAIYHNENPRFGLGASVYPAGSILWASLACFLLVLKTLDRRSAQISSYGKAFSLAYLVWIMMTIAATAMMILVRHGVTATYDDVVALGILTLGQTQLGFAGIFGKGLAGSTIGRLALNYSYLVGVICFIISCYYSVFYFLWSSTGIA